MIFSKDLRDTRRELSLLLGKLKAQADNYPGYRLMRTRSRGKEIFCKVEYSGGKRKRTVIDHGGTDYFEILKGMCINARKEIVEADLALISSLEEKYRDISSVEIIDLMAKKYPRIDRRDIIIAAGDQESSESELSDWAREDYKQAVIGDYEKYHLTSRGLKVRSKSEAAICEILYANGIEFRYEEIMYLDGRKFIPDFKIRRKSDGKIFYLEHCGMMDDPAYRKRNREKLEWYEMHDIVPWDNLIVTYDRDGSIDLKYIESIVKAVLAA